MDKTSEFNQADFSFKPLNIYQKTKMIFFLGMFP